MARQKCLTLLCVGHDQGGQGCTTRRLRRLAFLGTIQVVARQNTRSSYLWVVSQVLDLQPLLLLLSHAAPQFGQNRDNPVTILTRTKFTHSQYIYIYLFTNTFIRTHSVDEHHI